MNENNEFFQSKGQTLGVRLDSAWEILNHEESTDREKLDALEFLIFVFDLEYHDHMHDSLIDHLVLLMAEREIYKPENPEYIPGHFPQFLEKLGITPWLTMIPKIDDNNKAIEEIDIAIKNKEILDVTPISKKKDAQHNPNYLTPEERAAHRLLIKNGKFYYEGKEFDSSEFTSHNKKGFVAYTINANGEISFFNHLNMHRDKNGKLLFHSSMNAGSPVVAAGEIKIEKGRLKEITTHSGHYGPSLFNVYRALSYFEDKKVDMTGVKVITVNKVSDDISKNSKESVYKHYSGKPSYETPATDILDTMKVLLNKNIETLNRYKKGDFKSAFLRFIGSKLTQKRDMLADKMSEDINLVLNSKLKPSEKIEFLTEMTDAYIKDNNLFSTTHGKKEHSGRLNDIIHQFKNQLELIKEQTKDDENRVGKIPSSYKKNF